MDNRASKYAIPVSAEVPRGSLIIIRNSEGRVMGAQLGGKLLEGFRSVEQRLVTNAQQGTYLAVTLALECDNISFIDLPPPVLPGEEELPGEVEPIPEPEPEIEPESEPEPEPET